MDLQYSFNHTVIYSETGIRGLMTLPAISALFQEAALLQAEVHGFGESYCREEGRMWVLSRLQTEIVRLPGHRESIVVETWPKVPQGPLARRDYRILDSSGAEIVRATSGWMLLDTSSLRPVRPQAVFEKFDFSAAGEAIPGTAGKIPPSGDIRSELEVTARYSDLDQQGHVNNIRYLRWATDCYAPEEINRVEPSGFAVSYAKSAAWNDRVLLQRSDAEGSTTVRGILSDGSESFACSIQYKS